jgi:cell division protein FtsW (lipid II flippase)
VARQRAAIAEPSTEATPALPPYRTIELGLLFLSAIIVTALYVLASLGSQGHMPDRLWAFLSFVLGLSLFLHVAIGRLAPFSSQVLLPLATLLNGIGYVEIARWNPSEAESQAGYILISALVLVAVLIFVKRIRDLDRYRYLLLVVAILLMLSPLVPHVGRRIGGARLWIHVGTTTFQPVEIAKILLAIFFASYFAANKDMLSASKAKIRGWRLITLRTLLPILFAWGFAILILGAENDIGFSMLLFTLFIALIWVATGRMFYVLSGAALFGLGLDVGSRLFHQVHVRFTVWLDPWTPHNFAGSGGQLALGWYSIAAGGLTGVGLGLGQSGNIPELTSDMIFAAIAEELGLIGVVIVLGCFIMFVAEGFRIAQKSHSDFARLTATALSLTVGLQAFFIMAGVLRILPFTGITLPFMAYGGSSLIANYAIVALLLRISDENHTEVIGGEVHAVSFKERAMTQRQRRRTR